MYKAIEKIGGYEIGEEVPEEQAIIWDNMYLKSPVQKVGESKEEPAEEKVTEEIVGAEEPKDVMLDDYLGRNTNVVIKNIRKDDLSPETLKSLLILEESSKNRNAVKKAIKKKLDN